MATVETISACENVWQFFSWLPQFFSWFSQFMSVAADIATVVAVFVAVCVAREWSLWKKQVIAQRGHDIALEAVEELRKYENLLNAARYRPTDTAEYNDEHFEDADDFLKQAGQSRQEVVRLCDQVGDLGLGTAAKKSAMALLHCEDKIKRTLKRAREASDRSDEKEKWNYLSDFFWSPGVDNELSLELEKCQDKLRNILLDVVRISH